MLTVAASAIWCAGPAAAGWALGGHWDQVHHAFRYADYVAVAAVVAVATALVVRHRRAAAA